MAKVRRSPRAVVGLAALALALACGLAWWLWPAAPAPDSSSLKPQADEARHPISIRPASAPEPSASAVSAPPPEATQAKALRCGPGLVDQPASGSRSSSDAPADRPPTPDETALALSHLDTSPEAVDALAAITLRAIIQVERDFNQAAPARPACAPGDSACTGRWQQRYQTVVQTVHAASARQASEIALRSGEPVALQMALHLCAALSTTDRVACNAPLLRAWTAREPDNATPWLMLATSEREQGDLQASAEALYRASQAPRVVDGSQGLWGVMAGSAFDPKRGVAAADLQVRWAGLVAGMNYLSLGNVAELCGDAALRDGNQRQSCDALARRMITQGSSLIHRVEGLALGHRLGWPDDELRPLRQQVHRLLKADSDDLQSQGRLDACQTVQRRQDRAAQVARQGEVSRLERQIGTAVQAR